jgi:hypothetical protein
MAATPRVLTGNTTLFGTSATQIYTVNKPTGIVDGDFILIQFGINNTAAGSFTTVPSGWIPLFTTNPYWLTPSNTIAAFYKFASNEPSTWNFVYSPAALGSAIVFAASGVDTTNPINVLSAMSTGSNATHIAPSITTTVANCIQIAGAIHQSGTTQTLLIQSGWTLVGTTYGDGSTTVAGRIGTVAHNGNVAQGATSTATFTGSQALTGMAWQAALAPATAQAFTQTFTNTTGITDINTSIAYSGTTINNISSTDTINPILASAQAFTQTFTDPTGITDANIRSGYSGTTTDIINSTDISIPILTGSQSLTQTFTDLTGITDANVKSGYAGITVDTENLSDILTPILTAGPVSNVKFITGSAAVLAILKPILGNIETSSIVTLVSAGVQPTGADITRYQDLAGATMQAKINAATTTAVSLPIGTFEFSDFAVNGSYGVMLPQTVGSDPLSILGSGSNYTEIRMTPQTNTQNDNIWDGVSARPTVNQRLMWFGGTSGYAANGVRAQGFTLNSTPQTRATPTSGRHPAVADQNAMFYNGLEVAYCYGAVVDDVKVTGVPGYDSGPPGETFALTTWHAHNVTFNNTILDGRTYTNGVPGAAVTATLFGTNDTNNLTINGGDWSYAQTGFAGAFWHTNAASITNLRMTNCSHLSYMNLEASCGEWIFDNVYMPIGSLENHMQVVAYAPGASGGTDFTGNTGKYTLRFIYPDIATYNAATGGNNKIRILLWGTGSQYTGFTWANYVAQCLGTDIFLTIGGVDYSNLAHFSFISNHGGTHT